MLLSRVVRGSATGFAMYCFFNILNPLVTILFAVSGLRVWKAAVDTSPGNALPRQG
ncbi:hypothetical protein [Azospirillum brasilense]|uniref:hypothetical protein n=1 Tax=Azospirillum brasilense TaxID=192 RepID=UPI00155246E7|nr:hypothetical protein [Azospirillum brasilense]